MRGSERDRDEVEQRRDAERDLAEGGRGGPGAPALRRARERVRAEAQDGAARDEVLREQAGEREDGLEVS